MDTVRFGRVLGQGARQAAKTLVSAVDAATAPNPGQPTARPSVVTPPPPSASTAASSPVPSINEPHAGASAHLPSPSTRPHLSVVAAPVPITAAARNPIATSPRAPQQPRTAREGEADRSLRPRPGSLAPRGLAEGSRRFGRAVWAPAVRLSGVLWLELTGVFFALFALIAAIAAWRLRAALHTLSAASDDRTRLLFAAGMALVFGYFSLSSFLKAHRRSRQP